MKRQKFPKSKMIHSMDYDEEKETLVVRFISGSKLSTYEYNNVPLSIWNELIDSDSISAGKTFTRIVKGKFEYRRV